MATVFEGVFIVITFSVMIFIEWKRSKAEQRNMGDLAAELGLKLDVTGMFLKTIRLTGEIRGKEVEVFSPNRGRGAWVCVTVCVTVPPGYEFSLEPREFSNDVVAWIARKKELKFDANFDQRWVLEARQPKFVGSILLPEIRQQIMRLAGDGSHQPTFKLEKGRVQYSQEGHFSRAGVCVRVSEGAKLLCDLADAIEVGVRMKNPAI